MIVSWCVGGSKATASATNCFLPVNNWLSHSYVAISLVNCEAIKETQTRWHLLQQSIHPLAVFHT